jgi:hypothetical protein
VSGTAALAVLAVVAITVAGCATANPGPRDSRSPQVRCLVDPHETGMRPLIFFFCIESP